MHFLEMIGFFNLSLRPQGDSEPHETNYCSTALFETF